MFVAEILVCLFKNELYNNMSELIGRLASAGILAGVIVYGCFINSIFYLQAVLTSLPLLLLSINPGLTQAPPV
jgi:hypothetical protein